MNEKYEKAEMIVVLFETNDILTTSGYIPIELPEHDVE